MTKLYRVFSQTGRLLYIGIANRLGVRLTQHEERADWFNEMAVVEVSRYHTRDEALIAEGQAINKERPQYNQRASGSSIVRRRRPDFEEQIALRLAHARARLGGYILATVGLYCDTRGCPVREITLHVKELPGDEEPRLPASLRCPACGQPAKPDMFTGLVYRDQEPAGGWPAVDVATFLADGPKYERIA